MMVFSELLSRIGPMATPEAVPKDTKPKETAPKDAKGCSTRIARWGAGLLTSLLLSTCLQAAELTPSTLAPSQDTAPILTLQAADHREQLSLADIERLPLHEATLQHPEGEKGVYSGVLLEDFLRAHALGDAKRLRLIAVDNYSIFLKQAQRKEKDYLLVTRFNGAPIPQSQRGPLMLVVPADEAAVLEGQEPFDKWIWSLAKINAS
ncbi:molybdopterin-dependent oxidoreductase [Onishia taeanensis]